MRPEYVLPPLTAKILQTEASVGVWDSLSETTAEFVSTVNPKAYF